MDETVKINLFYLTKNYFFIFNPFFFFFCANNHIRQEKMKKIIPAFISTKKSNVHF